MRGMMGVTLVLAVVLAGATRTYAQEKACFFVAVDGDDGWSGALPAPNVARTDGPFKTLQRAREALRERKQHAAFQKGDLTVMVRGGTYFLPETLVFTPEDSGTPEQPVRYLAYPGEKPILSGGRPVTGWQPAGNGLYTTTLPDVKAGGWFFRQLRVGDRWQQQARYPNYDEINPLQGGWLLADDPVGAGAGAFGATVINIHNTGDFLEWEVNVPATGEYRLFLYAGVNMKPFGKDGMAGQTAYSVDGGEPIVLQGPPDTGAWDRFVWSECCVGRI